MSVPALHMGTLNYRAYLLIRSGLRDHRSKKFSVLRGRSQTLGVPSVRIGFLEGFLLRDP